MDISKFIQALSAEEVFELKQYFIPTNSEPTNKVTVGVFLRDTDMSNRLSNVLSRVYYNQMQTKMVNDISLRDVHRMRGLGEKTMEEFLSLLKSNYGITLS